MTKLEKVLYTGKTHTTGGRDGTSRSEDGRLDIKLSSPGTAGGGTNPEQLFAAGWSACFIGAIGLAAAKGRSLFPAIWPSTPKSISARLAAPTSSRLASTSACRVWSARLPRRWWTPHTRPAPTPKLPAATSTSRSTWSEPDLSGISLPVIIGQAVLIRTPATGSS